MTAKTGNNCRRRPVPDLEQLAQAVGEARAELAVTQAGIKAIQTGIDADLLDGHPTAARRRALKDLIRQERAATSKIDELELKVAAFGAARLDLVVAKLAAAAVASTARMLEAHSRPINLDQFQLGKQK